MRTSKTLWFAIETVVDDALKKDATDVQGDIAAAVADKAQETDDKESAQAESHELSEEEALALIEGKGD